MVSGLLFASTIMNRQPVLFPSVNQPLMKFRISEPMPLDCLHLDVANLPIFTAGKLEYILQWGIKFVARLNADLGNSSFFIASFEILKYATNSLFCSTTYVTAKSCRQLSIESFRKNSLNPHLHNQMVDEDHLYLAVLL